MDAGEEVSKCVEGVEIKGWGKIGRDDNHITNTAYSPASLGIHFDNGSLVVIVLGGSENPPVTCGVV
jgi:hypothetical protein